jgi:predicted helicase
MSKLLISQYLNELSRLKQVSGTHRESVVREAFKDLLKGYARSHDLVFVPEFEIESPAKERRYVDGALLHALRMPFGYWEAKDEKDDLDTEIATKFKRGYPKDNIIFEDSTQAVLIQNGIEVLRCQVDDVDTLQRLLNLFFGYQRPEIAEFRKAVQQFTTDLPQVLKALREMIDAAHADNVAFRDAAGEFLEHARKTINPGLVFDDIREILIQHILTDEIFDEVFPGQPFHRDNNVARELHKLEDTFFTGNTKFQLLKSLEVYYRAIRGAAARIGSHHEKQTFLKVVYENFYKVYNPKAADRLGVVYTPGEIVRFMIESADWLCEQHFKRNLIDRDVEILDPAVGTGTFITELIEHFRGQPAKLAHKYAEELHANEVGILPYYVANLNIEATYAAITGQYVEFPGLCLVDTLDNVAGLGKKTGDHVADLFGMGDENVERIKRQNRRKISVIIGNPPYNANQANENDNNKNREYPEIDRRIKDSYIKASTAQKTKLYDMYSRFFRWATDRIADDGIVAFITNRSFLDKRTFDGFRRAVASEFNFVYVVDLGGDVRDNPRLSGTTHNVFGIQTGVAISFLVRKRDAKGCELSYIRRPEMEGADDKLAWLSKERLQGLTAATAKIDESGIWINRTANDFDGLLPIGSKLTKSATTLNPKSLFKLYSLGVSTNRDEWVSGYSGDDVTSKMRHFVQRLEEIRTNKQSFSTDIKWSRNLKRRFLAGRAEPFESNRVTTIAYRPFVKFSFYDSDLYVDERGSADAMFPRDSLKERPAIAFIGDATEKPFSVLAVAGLTDLNFLSPAAAGTKLLPLVRSTPAGDIENITDWALKQFREHYGKVKSTPPQSSPAAQGRGQKAAAITKDAIFHYVYAVLHDPLYREKYAHNLKREFPRIPLYGDTPAYFWRWAAWGEALMTLHIGYETVDAWPLARTDMPDDRARTAGQSPKPMLKADKAGGCIVLDSETTLSGIPPEAWDYRLGNRSALEWILDQYKESRPRDPTIREKFDTYRFADYKDKVIDLLARVTRVSVETQAIVEAMRRQGR